MPVAPRELAKERAFPDRCGVARIGTSLGAIGVDECGTGDAIPLVFLHGVGSDKSAWAPQLAHFGETRRAVALDYPGYGESAPATPSDAAPHDRFADAILAALDALGIQRAHLCGLSLGGVVAIAIAHRAPDRLASLAIADSFAVHPDGPAILARSLAASANMRALAEARVPALLAANADPTLAAELVEVMASIPPDAFRLACAAVWPADQRGRAATIALPTLILCGTQDRVTPPALSEQLAALIPNSELLFIDGAGHLPNLEQPTNFNVALDIFVARGDVADPELPTA